MKKLFFIILAIVSLSSYAQQGTTNDDPNSITVTDRGVKYRLISIGDKLPRLFVNDREVSDGQLNTYAAIIDKLQNQLWERQKKQALTAGKGNDEQVRSIVKELISQKIIASANALNSLRLDNNGFIVNGLKQSFATYTLFKNKFLKSTDIIYRFNSN